MIVMKALGEDLEDIVRDMVRNWEKWHFRDTEHVHEKETSLAGLPAELFAVTYIANSTT